MSDNKPGERSEPERRRIAPGHDEDPDVYLNVPVLKVDEISLEVESLDAHVALAAQVLDLLKLNVGADALLGKVKLEIRGIEAEARLEVRLDHVSFMIDRVLTTLDRNPEILEQVGRGVAEAARGIGGGAGKAVREVGKSTAEDTAEGTAEDTREDTAEDTDENVEAGDREERDGTPVRDAYRDTEESVRDLGRTLLRMVTQRSRPF